MIDIKAFRHDPEPFLEGARRKGAYQPAADLLNADQEWRARVASVDELRAQQKVDGKPSPEQLEVAEAALARCLELELAADGDHGQRN